VKKIAPECIPTHFFAKIKTQLSPRKKIPATSVHNFKKVAEVNCPNKIAQ
jgi:hypothetical protein